MITSFAINIWNAPYHNFFLLYCNAIRVRIWVSIHYTYTYFNIFSYYKFIHSFLYQSSSTVKTRSEISCEIATIIKRALNRSKLRVTFSRRIFYSYKYVAAFLCRARCIDLVKIREPLSYRRINYVRRRVSGKPSLQSESAFSRFLSFFPFDRHAHRIFFEEFSQDDRRCFDPL